MPWCFVVICKAEGQYLLATRRVFETREEAEAYARTVSESRDPIVVEGRWGQLRFFGR